MISPKSFSNDIALRSKGKSDFIIKIVSHCDQNFQGYIEHIHTGQWQSFDSLAELLQLLNNRMNDYNSPQEANSFRTWKS